MPSALGWAVTQFAVFVAGATGGAISFTAAAYLGTGLAIAGTMYGLKKLSEALAPDMPAFGESTLGRLVTGTSTIEPQPIVYGTVRKGGVIVFQDVSNVSPTDDDNGYLWQVVALAGHEIDSFQFVHLQGRNGPVDINVSTDIDGSDRVTHADFIDGDGNYNCSIWFYLGTDSQTANSNLTGAFPTKWTSNHRGRGIAYAVIRYRVDDSKSGNDPDNPDNNVWSGGVPNPTFTIRGKKVKDPRNSPTTTAWSDNSALCLADYLQDTRLGLGIGADEVDEAYLIAAANVCEESATVPDGQGNSPQTSTTQERYSCNGLALTNQSPAQIVQNILSSMAGSLGYTSGKFQIHAGAYDTPTQTITESWLRGGLECQASAPRGDRYNVVRGRFVDSGSDYQMMEYEVREDATYQANDGGVELEKSVDFPFTTDQYEAQRLALIALKKSRNQQILNLQCNLKAMTVALYEVVNVTIDELGYSSKPFRCINWKINKDGGVDLVLVEESSADWTYNWQSDLTEVTAPTTTLTPTPERPSPPTGLTATTVAGGVSLEWVNPDPNTFDVIEVYGNQTGTRPTSTSDILTVTRGEQFVHAATAGSTWYYWLKSRGRNGNRSSWAGDGASPQGSVSGTAGSPGVVASYSTNNGTRWTRNSAGVWTPATTTTVISFTFDRADSTIATMDVTVTRAADGTLTAAETASTGEATTSSFVGNGTNAVTVQASHDASNASTAVLVVSSEAAVSAARVNLTPTIEWTIPATDPMGGWDIRAGSLSNSSLRSDVAGPYSTYPLTMQVQGNGTAQGWFTDWRHYFPTNPNKTYKAFLWVRRRSSDSNGVYCGWTNGAGYLVDFSSPNRQTNPYFVGNPGSQMTVGEWYLAAGIIHPAGVTPATTDFAGLYNSSGTKVADGLEYAHDDTVSPYPTQQYLRFGFYSNTTTMNTDDGFQFIPIGVFEANGTEPEIEALLKRITNQGDLATLDTIPDSSYIDNEVLDDAQLFTSTIRPVIVVGALPTLPDTAYPNGQVVLLTTDGKLYRNDGGTWYAEVGTPSTGTIDLETEVSGALQTANAATGLVNANITINADGSLGGAGSGQASLNSLPGDISETQIEDNAISTAKIQANAITANEVDAGAITAGKIAITSSGAALNRDPNLEDLEAWYSNPAQSSALVSEWSLQTFVSPGVGLGGFQLHDNDDTTEYMFSERIALDPQKTYRVRITVRQWQGDRKNYLACCFYDDNGDVIAGGGGAPNYGWPSGGTYHYWGVYDNVFPTAWTTYEFTFGPDGQAEMPTASNDAGTQAYAVSIGGLFTRDGAVGTDTYINFAEYRIEEVLPGELIVDGAITAAKIQAGAIGADQIAANAIAAKHIVITDFENLFGDGSLESYDSDEWEFSTGEVTTNTATTRSGSVAFKHTPTDGISSAMYQKLWQVEPGDEIYFEGWSRDDVSNDGSPRFVVHEHDGDQSYIQSSNVSASGSLTVAFSKFTGDFTVPAGTYFIKVGVGTSSQTAGSIWWDDIVCRRKKAGELIVDGAITADKMAANSITAANGAIENLAVTSAKINDVSADKITAGTVNAAITQTSNLVLSTSGKIYTSGKTSATDGDKGIFIGHDGGSNYDLGIGQGTTKSLIWDGSAGTLTIYGDIVDTGNVVDGAIQNIANSFNSGLSTHTASAAWQRHISVDVSSSSGEPVRIYFGFRLSANTSSQENYQMRCVRGDLSTSPATTTVIEDVSAYSYNLPPSTTNASAPIFVAFDDTSPAASKNYRYWLEIQAGVSKALYNRKGAIWEFLTGT